MSDTEKLEQIARLLEQMLNNQKAQLERQEEALAIQKEQFQVFLKQAEKTAQIQARAEALQEKSAQMVNRAHKLTPLILIAVMALIICAIWLVLKLVLR